eukprot:SAG22_NODE_185_length_15941_cov_8.668034_7_plen_405_part_00
MCPVVCRRAGSLESLACAVWCLHWPSNQSSCADPSAWLLPTIVPQAACSTHSTFTLNFLISSPGAASDAIICDMLQKTQQQNLTMSVVTVERSNLRGDDQPQKRHALTLMKEDLGFDVVTKVAAVAAEANFNVLQVDRLSPLIPDELDTPSLTAIEFILEETESTSVEAFKQKLAAVQEELACDRALQREGSLRRNKRLVVMDMDSTLIVNEVIDEIARINGCYEQVAEVTERAMNGELDFNESLVERVKCLKGAPASVFDDVYNVIELTPGAEDFIWALQTMGYKIAVVSGGFNQITNRVKSDLGIDFAFANTLEVIDGTLTGRTIGPIVDRERKRDLLESLAQTMNIELEQVIAIGDGANDLSMIDAAGLGIAFCAKPNVQVRRLRPCRQFSADTQPTHHCL